MKNYLITTLMAGGILTAVSQAEAGHCVYEGDVHVNHIPYLAGQFGSVHRAISKFKEAKNVEELNQLKHDAEEHVSQMRCLNIGGAEELDRKVKGAYATACRGMVGCG